MANLHPVLSAATPSEVGAVGDLVIVLAASGLAALTMRRLGLAVIPAFLLAGMLLGPHALSLVPSPDQLGAISHLAIIVLLFGIGLDLHLSSLRGRVLQLVGAAALALGLTVLVLWLLAQVAGLDQPRALLVAMALSLSSTAVVLKHLAARRELAHPVGRLSIAILVVQDLAVVAMLAVLPLLAESAGLEVEAGGAFSSLADVLLRIGAVAVFMVVSRWLMGVLLREALREGDSELVLVVGVAYALGAAWATSALGFSLEMGAFLAGFVLSGTRFRHELAGQIVPIRDLFLAVFFTTLGMQLDPSLIAGDWALVLGATLVLLAVKAVLIGGSCWLVGAPASVATLVGFSLCQAGEFSLVLLGAGADVGLLEPRLGALLIGVVVLSLVATPALALAGRGLALVLVRVPRPPWFVRTSVAAAGDEAEEGSKEPAEVVLAGFGPVGRRVAQDLDEAGISYVVIEMNNETLAGLHAEGRPAVLGDVRNESVLRDAGLEGARALVLAIPDTDAAGRACVLARRLAPDCLITVRAGLARAVGPLRAAGADHVIVDELAAADHMAAQVMAVIRSQP